MKAAELLNDEAFVQALKENGVTATEEEVKTYLVDQLNKAEVDGELNEDDLANVAGGVKVRFRAPCGNLIEGNNLTFTVKLYIHNKTCPYCAPKIRAANK